MSRSSDLYAAESGFCKFPGLHQIQWRPLYTCALVLLESRKATAAAAAALSFDGDCTSQGASLGFYSSSCPWPYRGSILGSYDLVLVEPGEAHFSEDNEEAHSNAAPFGYSDRFHSDPLSPPVLLGMYSCSTARHTGWSRATSESGAAIPCTDSREARWARSDLSVAMLNATDGCLRPLPIAIAVRQFSQYDSCAVVGGFSAVGLLPRKGAAAGEVVILMALLCWGLSGEKSS
ncbi:hypothetical protein KC356_g147 [Hortaea werneckii]|nr:hypothetical protein KC356_g147 [Hortaea werneckii]